jgi:hypothetical protein
MNAVSCHAVAAVLVLTTASARAEPCADPSALRAALEHEAARAEAWNLAWQIGYTATALGQAGLAVSVDLSHDNTQGLWVGSVKSALGAIASFAAPLRIEIPAATADRCADRTALRAAAEQAAERERRMFWLGHAGGLGVNLAVSAILAATSSWKAAATSFAIGYPIALLNVYTMPRASWRRVREPAWTAGVAPLDAGWSVVLAGRF